jgi:hypothetical protein
VHQISALTEARRKKVEKYEPIVKESKNWLQDNLDEIEIQLQSMKS